MILVAGDELVLRRNGTRAAATVAPAEYHALKSVAHTVLALYAHLADVAVAVHDHVTAGQVLGRLPAEEPANLYFEVRLDGRPADPEDWLAKPAKKR